MTNLVVNGIQATFRLITRFSTNINTHHQHMEFTFHNSYVILELVPSTVIFWTELSCWRKSYSNKATMLLGMNSSLKKFTKGIILNYLAFIYFSFERTWWRLFQNRVVRTKLTSNFYWKMTSKKWKLKECSN
jgi:hypothetical protein